MAKQNMSNEIVITDNTPMPKPNPWGKGHAVVVPCSLEDVMSEQLAQELGKKETSGQPGQSKAFEHNRSSAEAGSTLSDAEFAAKLAAEEDSASGASAMSDVNSDAEFAAKLAVEEGGDLSTDELIAHYLQRDFDRELNSRVDMVEKTFNGTNKVSISFENYKQREQSNFNQDLYDDDDDDEDNDDQFPEYATQTSWKSPPPVIGSKGYLKQGKKIVTKHDKDICGRRNAERLMEFPPEFESGDGEGMDMQLPNKVYNYLKAHSISENKRGHKVHEKKDHSTAIKAVDERTRILMFKMVNSGFLSSIEGVVNEGKEAVIFKAIGGMRDEEEIPKDIILKVYKTTMNEFKTRAKYVYGDHRLSKDIFRKQNPRKIMRLWAEKEYINLKRMKRHNLPCPIPLTLKKHVLAMTCIGGEHPAPKLKDVRLTSEHMQDAYEQTIDKMKKMYHDCGLVHADLSEYNLLWHDEKVWVIDVSQARERENANSNAFLLRDCQNICHFFRQAGVYNVSTAEDLFMDITNYSLEGKGKVFEAQVERYAKEDYAFDFYFELAEAVKLQDLNKDGNNSNSSGSEEERREDESDSKEDSNEAGIEVGDQKSSESNYSTNKVSSDKWVIDAS